MFRLLIFFLFFTVSSAFAGQVMIQYPIVVNDRDSVAVVILKAGPCGQTLSECYGNKEASGYTCGGYYASWCAVTAFSNNGTTFKLRTGSSTRSYANAFFQENDGKICSSNDECLALAHRTCERQDLVLSDFGYTPESDPPFTYACAEHPPTPDEECQRDIALMCESKLGIKSHLYTDDGLGVQSCTGICNDDSIAEPVEECTLYNNYCDVPDEPSELDFGAGGGGSSVDPSNTTAEDPVNDIDYEPDGTAADPTAPFSSIQGDKLINEVIQNRNDNTANLAETTDTTNQTIVEKSDDISDTISNSANGIIDAINDQPPFYDGNIVEGMKQFSVSIENLADIFGNLKEDVAEIKDELVGGGVGDVGYVPTGVAADFSAYDSIFSTDSNDTLEASIVTIKESIKAENDSFQTTLTNMFSLSFTSSPDFENRSLDLGDWGSHDISLNRFIALFNGIGNIIYFLAAMTALTIVLGGIKL